MDKAQKCALTFNDTRVSLKGTFTNGKPTGEIQVITDAGTVSVQSPFDGSESNEAPAEQNQPEEEKKEEVPEEAQPAPEEEKKEVNTP